MLLMLSSRFITTGSSLPGLLTLLLNLVRLLAVVDLLPLVETVREDQTPTSFKALQKEGFSEAVSPRAFIILLPISGTLAQEGIKPHRSNAVLNKGA